MDLCLMAYCWYLKKKRMDKAMPLLDREPMSYPNSLFESTGLRCWWVFQTRPRAEKALARFLRKDEAAYFLPQYDRTWQKKGRAFQSSLPLFPGYLFACGGESVRTAAFASNQVVCEIPVRNQSQLDGELMAISRLLGGNGRLRPEDRIPKGSRVLVVEGLYAGIEGRILETVETEELRIGIEVTLLGRGVSIVVERWTVRVLEPAAQVAGGGFEGKVLNRS